MKRLFSFFLLAFVATSCAAPRQLAEKSTARVEVRTETVTLTDTVFVELPVISQSVLTLDTLSVLENKYAKSAAKVSGRVLAHTLETKPVREPVTIEKQVVYRDSLVYQDRVVTETVEVERQLTGWQKFLMSTGRVGIIILLLVVIYIIFLIFKHLNLKLQ